jgi:LPXTG-site transpeptidase (sortase) family protein
MLIMAFATLGFVAWVGLFSRLHYDKVQLNAYEALRVELANGTAPNGPYRQAPESFGSQSSSASSIFGNGAPVAPPPPTLWPDGSPVAVLSIPAISLRTVILQGTTSGVLEGGPGHLRDTSMPGQVGISVILGRKTAYGGPFGGLASLVPGDSITVVTGQANALYKVIDLRRAGDPLLSALAAGAGRMVLVTADGSPLEPSGVLYVDADLMSAPQPAPPQTVSSSYLSASENAMGTEPAAWLPIVLWLLLLLACAGVLSWLWVAWGRWQTWLIAVPIVGFMVLSVSDEVTRLLPNLI